MVEAKRQFAVTRYLGVVDEAHWPRAICTKSPGGKPPGLPVKVAATLLGMFGNDGAQYRRNCEARIEANQARTGAVRPTA